MRSRRRALRAAIALAVVAGLAVGLLSGSGAPRRRPAPPLPASALRPPAVTLASLRGAPAIVQFWASWCTPCQAEAPALERFATSTAGRGKIVAVDYSEDAGAARSFVDRYHWTFPVLSDPDGTAGQRFGLAGLPTTFVLDAAGRIVATLRGPQTERSLESALAHAVRE
jgi:thiol-disulfide isomerase/thioredoxin